MDRKEKNAERKKKRRNYLRDICIGLLGNRCEDCEEQYPDEVYDFHHVDPSRKEYAVSRVYDRPHLLFKEVMKCVLLCANCHRIRHSGGCDDEGTN